MIERTTRSHYKIGPNGKLEVKKAYDSEMDALTTARYLNTKDDIIHKMIAYKCIVCGKWHVGGNGRVLTNEDREEARKKLKKYNHLVKKMNVL